MALSGWRLLLLIVLLLGLLARVWATDCPSPASPAGEFWPLVSWAALVVSVAGGVVWLWRIARGSSNRKSSKTHHGEPGPAADGPLT
jgi:hypothetical protein